MNDDEKRRMIDELSDIEVGMIVGTFMRTGDAVGANHSTPGVTFLTGLWIGVVAAKNPNYAYGLRSVLARVMARNRGISPEQVESEALQMIREDLKGTPFEDD